MMDNLEWQNNLAAAAPPKSLLINTLDPAADE
jgi:hypothetical protein